MKENPKPQNTGGKDKLKCIPGTHFCLQTVGNSVCDLSSSEVIYVNGMHESKWHPVLKKRAEGKVLWGSLHPFLSFGHDD